MNIPIQIPSMGESIVEVTIGTLLKTSGTLVALDEEIAEIETDKVNQVLHAPASGIVEWNCKTGDLIKVGAAIGSILPKEAPQKNPAPMKEITKETPKLKASEAPVRIPIDEALQSKPPIAAPEPVISSGRETRKKMSNLRKIIAQKLVEAKNQTALLTTFNEVDMSEVIHLRESCQENFQKKHGVKLGFMSFFIKASVAALQEFPDINARIDGDEIVYHNFFNIGVAVSTEKGLMVPVIQNADQKSYADLEKELKLFAEKARSSKIAISDLQGGTFTITNGGVFGSLISTPILNPPQSGILGMHNIVKRPIAVGDAVEIRPMMYIALSYDHRIVDGRESILFLMSIKKNLEEPSRLMLDL